MVMRLCACDNGPHMEQKSRVVLVEDDEVLADLLAKRLELSGMECIRYANGSDAVTGIMTGPRADLILLDIGLPDIDGFEILKRIAPFQATAQIPVIIVSNFSQDSDIAWGKKLGAKKFVNKASVTPVEIVDMAADYIAQARATAPQQAPTP